MFCRVKHISERATLGKVQVTVQTNVLVRFILIRMVDDEHLRQVVFALAHTEQFGFQETKAREAPAGSCPVLVLDGRDLNLLYCRELITIVILGVHRRGEDGRQHED